MLELGLYCPATTIIYSWTAYTESCTPGLGNTQFLHILWMFRGGRPMIWEHQRCAGFRARRKAKNAIDLLNTDLALQISQIQESTVV
jgi:hypothetical protein